MKRIKGVITVVYTLGIEERFINGVHNSPVYGLEIKPERHERTPEILTTSQIRELLRKAK